MHLLDADMSCKTLGGANRQVLKRHPKFRNYGSVSVLSKSRILYTIRIELAHFQRRKSQQKLKPTGLITVGFLLDANRRAGRSPVENKSA